MGKEEESSFLRTSDEGWRFSRIEAYAGIFMRGREHISSPRPRAFRTLLTAAKACGEQTSMSANGCGDLFSSRQRLTAHPAAISISVARLSSSGIVAPRRVRLRDSSSSAESSSSMHAASVHASLPILHVSVVYEYEHRTYFLYRDIVTIDPCCCCCCIISNFDLSQFPQGICIYLSFARTTSHTRD